MIDVKNKSTGIFPHRTTSLGDDLSISLFISHVFNRVACRDIETSILIYLLAFEHPGNGPYTIQGGMGTAQYHNVHLITIRMVQFFVGYPALILPIFQHL